MKRFMSELVCEMFKILAYVSETVKIVISSDSNSPFSQFS
jgi:hypothetical protein